MNEVKEVERAKSLQNGWRRQKVEKVSKKRLTMERQTQRCILKDKRKNEKGKPTSIPLMP